MAENGFKVLVLYSDRRQGPSSWPVKVEVDDIEVAISKALRRFFLQKPYSGRLRPVTLTVEANKL